ncbi:DUF1007 family protein [uncultured Litoreibacter sp.]|uniref:DUF1007 family protein n=1 Tax=uncultured Litoreibacter sp. TaxID=1392394 RepID=UPI0026222218|nr:DUF1007 family protein [uncultured Litoreibacter sp.]
MRYLAPLIAAALLAPQAADAHPHVFVQAGVDIVFDRKGRLTHIKVTWGYDAFYSLLIAEDKGLDKDGDGTLTKREERKLAGFDAKWAPGFNGDLVAKLDGQPLKLSGPMKSTATMVNGQIVSTHIREVTGNPLVGGDTLSVQAFDESYYTSYELTLPVRLVGNGQCAIRRVEPDIDNELAQMEAMLLSIDADADLEEMDIPMLGEAFATEILVSCPST